VPEGQVTADSGDPPDWSNGAAGDHAKLACAATGNASPTHDKIVATRTPTRRGGVDVTASVRIRGKQPATQLI
jgi:hypothetical protein